MVPCAARSADEDLPNRGDQSQRTQRQPECSQGHAQAGGPTRCGQEGDAQGEQAGFEHALNDMVWLAKQGVFEWSKPKTRA